MKVYGQLESAMFENLASDPANAPTGRAYFNTSTKKIKYYDGTTWQNVPLVVAITTPLPGGNAVEWFNGVANGATEGTEFNEKIFSFGAGLGQLLWTTIKVPQAYTAGAQIKLYVGIYSPSTSNTILISSTSYLIRKATDDASSTTNSNASTNTAITNATTANKYQQPAIDITDASGKINGISVSAGDLIKVQLTRGTDSDTADIRLLSGQTEVTFT